MTTHVDLAALKALVNDRWKMVDEIKQLGDSEGVIWDDEEMARFEYLRRQISKGDTELANAFPALVARIEAAERVIVTIYYEVVLGLTVQSTARLANMGCEMEQHIIKALGGDKALVELLERYRGDVTPSWATTDQHPSAE